MKVVKGTREKRAFLAVSLGTLVMAAPHVLKRDFVDLYLRNTLQGLLHARAGA